MGLEPPEDESISAFQRHEEKPIHVIFSECAIRNCEKKPFWSEEGISLCEPHYNILKRLIGTDRAIKEALEKIERILRDIGI